MSFEQATVILGVTKEYSDKKYQTGFFQDSKAADDDREGRMNRIREKLNRKRKAEGDMGNDEDDDVEKIIDEEKKEKQKQEL